MSDSQPRDHGETGDAVSLINIGSFFQAIRAERDHDRKLSLARTLLQALVEDKTIELLRANSALLDVRSCVQQLILTGGLHELLADLNVQTFLARARKVQDNTNRSTS
jgi:hypothetical protein